VVSVAEVVVYDHPAGRALEKLREALTYFEDPDRVSGAPVDARASAGAGASIQGVRAMDLRDYKVLAVGSEPSETAYGFVRGGKLLGYFTSRKEALAWFLRHPEEWPEGFRWNYGELSLEVLGGTEVCALGLAGVLWPALRVVLELPFIEAVPRVAEWLGLEEAEVVEIFYGGGFLSCHPVTAAMVAERLDMREEEAVRAEHWWRTQAYGASAVKVTGEGVELVDLPAGAYQRGLDELGVRKDWGVLSGLRDEVEQHRERLFNLEKLLGVGVEENFKLVEAVFKARIEALDALRRVTTSWPQIDVGDTQDLADLYEADARLRAAQEALAGKT
jgi:hypothetical protein